MAKDAKHEKLCEAAKAAIDTVNSDTSVSPQATLTSLRDIRRHITMLMDAIEESECEDDEE